MKSARLAWFFGALLLLAACGERPRDRAAPAEAGPAHVHQARHGGALAEIGEEEGHVEFAYGDAPDVLQAYFFDGEMEQYVRVSMPSFSAVAVAAGREYPLTFVATASTATGETVGDSALFEAKAGWLADGPALQVTVPALVIKGRTYAGVTARLPARPRQ